MLRVVGLLVLKGRLWLRWNWKVQGSRACRLGCGVGWRGLPVSPLATEETEQSRTRARAPRGSQTQIGSPASKGMRGYCKEGSAANFIPSRCHLVPPDLHLNRRRPKAKDCLNCWSTARFRPIEAFLMFCGRQELKGCRDLHVTQADPLCPCQLLIWKVEDLTSSDLFHANHVAASELETEILKVQHHLLSARSSSRPSWATTKRCAHG